MSGSPALIPTLGGVLGHPPPAFERNAEVRTRGALVRAELVPIVPHPTHTAHMGAGDCMPDQRATAPER
jgi:hypothetical protein